MTEIAIPNGHQPADATPTEAQTSALVLWAYEARQAEQIATSLARTSFVPASLRGKPQDITAAILAGQELGLQPMATLRSIDIINGVPALRAHAMRGLIQSNGHTLHLVESTPERCVMRGRRAGEKDWQQVEWTLNRAAQLGLTGKDQWKKQPQTMLVARATGELCRLIAADVLYAMPYAAEELDGESPGGGSGPARVTVDEIVTARQAPAAPAAPTPPVEQPTAETFIASAGEAMAVDDLSARLVEAQAAGFARNLADASDPVSAAFMKRRTELANPATEHDGDEPVDADLVDGEVA